MHREMRKESKVIAGVLLWLVVGSGAVTASDRDDARVFRGEALEAVAMPVGGIGTGTIWVGGDGRLAVWQVFNNSDEQTLPDTFMAVRVAGEDGGVRILQSEEAHGLAPFADVSAVGEYPLLRVSYREPEWPIGVDLDAFNPMIPTSTRDSSLPCAVFRLTATNRTSRPVEASFLFSQQNPIGYVGGGGQQGRRYPGYGSNRNVFRELPGGGEMHFGVSNRRGPRVEKPIRIFVSGRSDRGIEHCVGVTSVGMPRRGVPTADAYWLEGLTGGEPARTWDVATRAVKEGKVLLITGAEESFWKKLVAAKSGETVTYSFDVFEDFEGGDYDGWTLEGAGFGEAPSPGTTPGQQHVSGFLGKGLVNTFVPNDVPQGRLLSREFTIEKRFIGFLVGGGSHRGRTCIRLLVDGKPVREQTGRNDELLEPASWEVADLEGKKARIEIVDRESGAWGHINVDQIIFSDTSPLAILSPASGVKDLAGLIDVDLWGVDSVRIDESLPSPLPQIGERWDVTRAISLAAQDPGSAEVLAESGGIPLLVSLPVGKATIVVALAKGLPASWGMALIARKLGATYRYGEGIDPASRLWGDLTLSATGGPVTANSRWTDVGDLVEDLAGDGRLSGPVDSGASPAGETWNGALSVPIRLEPRGSRTVSFVLTWSFPNVERYGHRGNKYSAWFEDASASARYVREHLDRLVADTYLYHDTMYETNLPYYVVDAVTSQSVIFRGPTCWWAREHAATGKDYFAGFEGCYRCCPLNCTHVWNYAQSHARLFPEIGRNLRWYDFMHYLKDTGETQHRQHSPHGAFIDGHCAVIEGAYREHLMSPDATFLKRIYPRVRLAVEWLIAKIDADEDGVNGGQQWNTYDVPTDGAHTFLGSQYLSALAAAEKMALVAGDEGSAKRWRAIREAGSRNQDERLWNGEYWIQIPDPKPARDYNTGCHSDQLLGQWWSHMLDNGYLYPRDRVRKALRSIFRYNFRMDFRGFRQTPRRYVLDPEGGMVMCSWPKAGRPNPFILYADEVWTGIEYEVAGLMLYEGLVDQALRIVKTARDRYDGRIRAGLNSGPGGNPFNELECGKYYARAMSSWSLLLAAQGLVYDGPKGKLGFRPRWKPEDHASFFNTAEGWGLFRQRQDESAQVETIECRWGRIAIDELVFSVPGADGAPTVAIGGRSIPARRLEGEADDVRLRVDRTVLTKGDTLTVTIPRRAGS